MRRSAAGIREALGSAVLELRRGKVTSRSSLAQALGIAASTGGLYVDLLIEAGYVVEAGLDQGPVGRPRRSLALSPEAGWFAGVEFHAARVQSVRVDFAGDLTAADEHPLPSSTDASGVIDILAQRIDFLAQQQPGRLLGVGVGAPGVIDPASGIARDYRFIPRWRNVAVVDDLQSRLGVPVRLENNLRTVAMAERWFGGGAGLENFICLGLRTGVGAGIVVDGKLVCGSHHAAGEVGGWPWPLGSGDGTRLEGRLSAPAIFRRISGLAPGAPIPADLRCAFAQLAGTFRSGSEIAPAWKPVIEDLAQFIACLHLLLNPSAFFLHGPVAAMGGEFCETVAASAQKLDGASDSAPLCVLPSKLGDEAGALGAAGFAMENWQPALKG